MPDTSQTSHSRQPERPPGRLTSSIGNDWGRDASAEPDEEEEAAGAGSASSEDLPVETAGFEPCEFQLASGNDVRVVFARFWERIRYRDWREGARPAQYYAIKIYSNEDVLSRQMATHCEFRGGIDFDFTAVPELWEWLDGLVSTRRFAEFDSLSDFIDDLAEQLNLLCDTGEDAVEHLDRLKEVSCPEAFDQEDDSIYNDQRDDEYG